MYIYILQVIFFISAGVMIFLMTRILPYAEEHQKEIEEKSSKGKYVLHKLDQQLLSRVGKILRKIHVLVMKLDRVVFKYIDIIKKQSNPEQEEKHIFFGLEEKEDIDNNKEEEGR